ncbi:NUDIX hydrolase [Halalkalibacillus halophilus]|uniref:NUDIX hydrolase n=1 Tax=Halalkalibacillus halophilus TaxID=392827 RepID=UPI000404101A|nr:NUDIX hydrolase [Halalkalibacillus halophilus]
MKRYEEKTMSTNEIYKGKVIDLQVDEVQLPNGKTSKRELVTHPGAVAVIALTEEGKLVLVEQYRKPLEKSILEIPAGKIEKNETPATTALRELEEETAYKADSVDYLISYYTSPGFADEIIYIYKANQIQLVVGADVGDEDEFVDVVEVDQKEAMQLITEERIHDAKTIQAIYYLLLHDWKTK